MLLDPSGETPIIAQGIRNFRAALPHAAIIVLACDYEEYYRTIALEAGVEAYISLRNDDRILRRSVQRYQQETAHVGVGLYAGR